MNFHRFIFFSARAASAAAPVNSKAFDVRKFAYFVAPHFRDLVVGWAWLGAEPWGENLHIHPSLFRAASTSVASTSDIAQNIQDKRFFVSGINEFLLEFAGALGNVSNFFLSFLEWSVLHHAEFRVDDGSLDRWEYLESKMSSPFVSKGRHGKS